MARKLFQPRGLDLYLPKDAVAAYRADQADRNGYGLTSTSMMVYQVLLAYDFDHDGEVWPSAEAIGAEIDLSRRRVLDHLARLEAAGWFERRSLRGPHPDIYRLTYLPSNKRLGKKG